MRKLIAVLLLAIFPGYAASLSPTVGWNVTNNANGNASNGGGFDPSVSAPGTNLSLSNPVSFTDLICTGTTCTSTTLAFSAASNGNLLNITDGTGCTTGRHEILSVTGSTATFNDSIGTGTCSGVAYGALDTWAHAEAAVNNAGQIIWIQCTGTPYIITSGITGASVAEHWVWGYQNTWNDQANVSWANRCWTSIQSNTAGMNIFTVAGGETVQLDGLELRASGSTFNQYAIGSGGLGLELKNCKLIGNDVATTVGIDEFGANISVEVDNSEISHWGYGLFTGNGVQWWTVRHGSYIHHNSYAGIGDAGFLAGFSFLVTSTNAIWDSNGYCVYISSSSSAPERIDFDHSVCSNSTHDGINNQTGHINNKNINAFTNSIFYGNAGYAITQPGCFSGPQGVFGEPAYNNATGSNGSGPYNCITSPNDVALGACNPFTNAAGGDFTLSDCAKAVLAAKGYPGATITGTGYGDIGPFQTKAATGGSSPHAYVQ